MRDAHLARIDACGRRQFGLVTTAQLRALGVTAKQRDRLVEAGVLRAVRKGVYRCAGVAPRWETMVMAAVLAAGPDAAAASFTAARLWNLGDRSFEESGLYVVSPRRLDLVGVTSRRATLRAGELAKARGIPVTAAARTIAEMAGHPAMGAAELGRIVDDALRRKLVRHGDLVGALVRCGGPGRRSLASLRRVLAERDGGYEPGANDWERRMDQWWDAAGLPPARRQYRTTAAGRNYIIDRAIVELRIAVEWNGYGTHGQFRSGFDATALRQLDLVSEGWAYIPVTTRTPLDAVCRAVWTAVRQRQTERPASSRTAGAGFDGFHPRRRG